jgi:VIT1/CCC1 family predicted Fe2+/Mn2+ transporter
MELGERWRAEKESAWLYRAVAKNEADPAKQRLFRSLGEAAEVQASLLAGDLLKTGSPVPDFYPSLRARLVAELTRRLGPRRSRPLLAALKVRGLSVYDPLPLQPGHPLPTSVAEIGQRHRGSGSGGNLRAAVFGVNDGLVSNTSLILGVAGASADPSVIVLSGAAGLLAGAFSMAAGEYVSVRSQRELYEYQIDQERDELERYPEEEAEELALIYNARGLPFDQARETASLIIQDKEAALKTLAREELGLNPDDLGSPWSAAVSSFLAFGAGAALPLVPFFLSAGAHSVLFAAGLSAAALFAVGALLSLFSGKEAWRGGLRMLGVGAAAGLMTFMVGAWLGTRLI